MKKTVTVTINATMFHIEEDAYEALQRYLNDLKKHFSSDESADEILADIEARISELLLIKVSHYRQVISYDDIIELKSIIGQPSDFGEQSESYDSSKSQTDFTDKKQHTKRLYRDVDNAVLGGVCSGLSHYFSVDVVVVRILFFCTIFFAGPFIYILAWIFVPRAQSTHQKMEMKGKRYDLDSIIENVRREIDDVAMRFSKYEREHQKKKKTKKPLDNVTSSCSGSSTTSVFSVWWSAVSLLFFTVLLSLIIAGIAFFVFVISGFSEASLGFNEFIQNVWLWFQSGTDYIFSSLQQKRMAFLGISFFVFAPFFLLIFGFFTLLGFSKKLKKICVNISHLLWIAGLVLLNLSILFVALDFRHKAHSQSPQTTLPYAHENLEIVFSKDIPGKSCNMHSGSITTLKQWAYIDCAESALVAVMPELEIIESADDSIRIHMYYVSRGRTENHAQELLQTLLITPVLYDRVLQIPQYIPIPTSQAWRKQMVYVTIALPGHVTYSLPERYTSK